MPRRVQVAPDARLRFELTVVARRTKVSAVAQACELPVATVWRMAKGEHTIDLRKLRCVAKHLGCELEWLLDGRNPPDYLVRAVLPERREA